MGFNHINTSSTGTATGSATLLGGHGGHLMINTRVSVYLNFDGTTAVSSANSLYLDVTTGGTNFDIKMGTKQYSLYHSSTSDNFLSMLEIW